MIKCLVKECKANVNGESSVVNRGTTGTAVCQFVCVHVHTRVSGLVMQCTRG